MAEHKGQHHANKDTAQNGRVQQGDVVVVNHVLNTHRSTGRVFSEDTKLDCILLDGDDVRGQEGEGGQRRRTDGEALTGGRGGVAEGIEHVGAISNKAGLSRHFRVATGVVSNRSVCVGGQGDTQGGEQPRQYQRRRDPTRSCHHHQQGRRRA